MGILGKIKDNTDAEENSNRMIISDNPSKNSPEKYASCAEYLGSILYKLGEIGYHGNKLEEYYIQGIEMIDYLESIEESEDRIIKWLDLFLFSNAQNNIEADAKIYVRLNDGEKSKTYEAFTTSTEESDYGYLLYLSKNELQSLGFLSDRKITIDIITGEGNYYKLLNTKEIFLKENQ